MSETRAPTQDVALRVVRIEAVACRHPLTTPVATSFGVLHDRPAVFVRIEDGEGGFGWGEAFANWPVAGAEHRVNLLMDDVSDLVFGRVWVDPPELFRSLAARTRIRALQCGEPGPFHQVIAALDIAAWDLVARRRGQPLYQVLTGDAVDDTPRLPVRAYASGIHIDVAAMEIPRARTAGFTAFKVKVGFDAAFDPDKVEAIARTLADGERLFVDANQAWDVVAAEDFLARSVAAGLGWVEEPIPADAPDADWLRLARQSIPLAGGENLAGASKFEAARQLGALRIMQPDVAKWGGITGCLEVARKLNDAGLMVCPHFLGGGVGLAASAHLLAAVGGEGLLEVDVNPNPLRDEFGSIDERVAQGRWHPGDAPGLGIEVLPEALEHTITLRREASRS